MYTLSNMIRVKTGYDLVAKGFSPDQMIDVMYDLTASNEQERLLLESASLDEIDEWYNVGDIHELILEAITIKRYSQADGKLKALARVLDKHLPENIEVEKDEAGGYAVQVGKPKKTGSLFATVTAMIPFTDGQALSIIFHSPDGDKTKIAATDEIIAFRFLLNKRDITHVVSPEKGKDVSLDEISKRVTRIVAKTSEKFQAKQKVIQEQKAELVQVEQSIESAAIQLDDEIKAAEKAKADLDAITPKVETAKTQVEKLEKVVGEKEKRLAELQAQKTASAGKTHGSNDRPETGHPNEPTPAAPLEVTPESAPQPESMLKSQIHFKANDLFHYVNNDMGMKSSGSFTREKNKWVVFGYQDVEKFLTSDKKPYAATKDGVFIRVSDGRKINKSYFETPQPEATPGPETGRKTEYVDWFVNYTETQGTGRTTDVKRFTTLKEARSFAIGKFGYITKISDGASDWAADKKGKTVFVEYFGGFVPSAQESLSIEKLTGEPTPKTETELSREEKQAIQKELYSLRQEAKTFGMGTEAEALYKAKDLEGLRSLVAGAQQAAPSETLPIGWTEAIPGGLATNKDPLTGGIVDKEIVSGEWFVIPNNDKLDKMTGFQTRESALANFAISLNSLNGNLEFDPTDSQDYSKVLKSEALQLKYQDELDAYFNERIIAVRNELRKFGTWSSTPTGDKLVANEFEYSTKLKQVGGSKNVVGVTHVLSSIYDDFKPIEMVDMLQLPPRGIAQMIENLKQDAYDSRNNSEIDAKTAQPEAIKPAANGFDPALLKKGYYIKRKILGLGDRPSPWELVTTVLDNGFMVDDKKFVIPFSDADITHVRTGMPELGRGELIYGPETQPKSTPEAVEPVKSIGHIAFANGYEYYSVENGDIHRAPIANPIMSNGRRSGRFEATDAAKESLLRMLGVQATPESVQLQPEPATTASKISPELAIKIAADDIESLRGIDVYRVLDTYFNNAIEIAAYIKANRPDLSKRVDEAMADLIPETTPTEPTNEEPEVSAAEPEAATMPVIFKTEVASAGDNRNQKYIREDFDKYLSQNVDKDVFEKVSGQTFKTTELEGFGYYDDKMAVPLKGGKIGVIDTVKSGADILQYRLLEVDRNQLNVPSQFFTGKRSGMYGIKTLQGDNDQAKYQDLLRKVYNGEAPAEEPEAVALANDILSGKYDNLPPDEMADLVEPIYDLPEDQYGDLMDQVDAYTTELTKKAVANI